MIKKLIYRSFITYIIFVIILTFFNYISYNDEFEDNSGEPAQFYVIGSGYLLLLYTPLLVIAILALRFVIGDRFKHSQFNKIIENKYLFFMTSILLCIVSSVFLTFFARKSACPLWQYKTIITGYNLALFVFIHTLFWFGKIPDEKS